MAVRCYARSLAVARGARAALPGARAPVPSAWCSGAPPLQFCLAPRRTLTAAVGAEPLQALAQKIAEDSALAKRLASEPVAAELLRVAAELPASAAEAQELSTDDESETPEPTAWQLKTYCKHNLIPFIGFGFFDNAIMILAGDFIDAKLGIAFGFTTMAAAAVGNTISDIIGLWVSGFVEAAAASLGLPDHGLTNAQRRITKVRILKNSSMIVGLVIGCILGMFPLIYPDEYRVWAARPTLEAQATN